MLGCTGPVVSDTPSYGVSTAITSLSENRIYAAVTILGDANADRSISVEDAYAMTYGDVICNFAADIDQNGIVNEADAYLLDAGLENHPHVGCSKDDQAHLEQILSR